MGGVATSPDAIEVTNTLKIQERQMFGRELERIEFPGDYVVAFQKVLPRIPGFRLAVAEAAVAGEKGETSWQLPTGEWCSFSFNPDVRERDPYTDGLIPRKGQWTQQEFKFLVLDENNHLVRAAIEITYFMGSPREIPEDKKDFIYVERHPAETEEDQIGGPIHNYEAQKKIILENLRKLTTLVQD